MTKNKNILFLIVTSFILILSSMVSASMTYPTVYYANGSTTFTRLAQDNVSGNQFILGLPGTYLNWYYINQTTGQLSFIKQYVANTNKDLFQLNNSHRYVTIYSGTVGMDNIWRYNSSFGNQTLSAQIVWVSNSGSDIFGGMVGKYHYKKTYSGGLIVKDYTNNSQVANIYPFGWPSDTSGCGALTKRPIGYDYDNDYLYFGCSNNTQLVYIKPDFWQTRVMYDNTELDETIISLYTDQFVTFGTESTMYLQFIKKNGEIYMLYKNNRSVIYSSQVIDQTAGLVDFGSNGFYSNNAVCWDSVGGGGYYSSGTSNAICLNATLGSGGTIYCNGQNSIQLCTGTCTTSSAVNPYGVPYKTANCNAGNCTNDCVTNEGVVYNINGALWSDTHTTYKVCGTGYDTDGCLEWSPQIQCGQYQLSYNGICETVNTSINYINQLNFGINPYSSVYIPNVDPPVFNNNLWNVTLTPNSVPMTLDVITNTGLGGSGSFPLYEQIPYSNPNYYVGFDCDYKSSFRNESIVYTTTISGIPVRKVGTETVLYDDFIINGLPVNKETITLVDDPSTNTSYSFSVTIQDVNNKVISKVWVVVNHVNGEIIVTDTDVNGAILWTMNYNAGITLGKMVLYNYQDFTRLEENEMLCIYRYVDANNMPLLDCKGVGVNAYKDPLATTPYKLTIKKESGQVYLNDVSYEQIQSSVKTFSKLVQGTQFDYINKYEVTSCVYLNDGCRTARTYLMERLGAQYFSYKDLKICTSNVNKATTGGGDSGGFGAELGKPQKLLIALLMVVLVPFFVLLMAFAVDDGFMSKVVFGLAGVSIVVLLVLFAVTEWIPLWIVLLIGIVGVMVTAGFLAKIFGGGDVGG